MAQSFWPLVPAEVTPGAASAWTDVDVSASVPAGATGVLLHCVSEGVGNYALGLRKNGSTDARINNLSINHHNWAAIGVDANRVFEAYVGHTTNISIWLVGYTTAGVTFFDNAYDKSLSATGAWTDIDCSAVAPGATGLIFEVVGAAGVGHGLRKNGSTDARVMAATSHNGFGVIIGCDTGQIAEGYIELTSVDFYLVGYITDGVTFNTNGVELTQASTAAWENLSPVLTSYSVMGIVEVAVDGGLARNFGLKEDASAEDIHKLGQHPWAFVDCGDASFIIEGYKGTTDIHFYVIGYADKLTTLIPSTLALTITTYAPISNLNYNFIPTTAALTITTYAPSVLQGTSLTPTTLALTITTYAPTVLQGTSVIPGTMALTITTYAPSILANIIVTPTTLALTITGYAPTINQANLITPSTLALTIATYAPTLSTTGAIIPVTLALTITTYAPSIHSIVYEYTLSAGGHNFFAKTYRNRLVIPGYIVVSSRSSDDPQYSGYAEDTDTPAELRKRAYYEYPLTGNAQGTAIAEAILQHYQIDAENGAASVPMNVGAECYDRVKVTDSNEGDARVGNIGQLTRYFSRGRFEMAFRFGGIELGSALPLSGEGGIGGGGIGGGTADYYEYIKMLYENQARIVTALDQVMNKGLVLDQQWNFGTGFDPSDKRRVFTAEPTTPYDVGDLWFDGDVVKRCIVTRASGAYVSADWEEITLDEIANGVNYSRVQTASLSAAGLVLLDQTVAGTYGKVLSASLSAGGLVLLDETVNGTYGKVLNASLSAGGLVLMDQVVNGTYGKVLTASLSAGGLVLLDETVEGTYGKVRTTDISAGHILVSSSTVFKTGSGSQWYNQGYISIDADTGLTISGSDLMFEHIPTGQVHYIYPSSGWLNFVQDSGAQGFRFNGDEIHTPDILPGSPDFYNVGGPSDYFANGYFTDIWYVTPHDLQHHDDMALIRGMKEDPKRPGKIDPETIPAVILQSKQEYLDKLAIHLDLSANKLRIEYEKMIEDELTGKNRIEKIDLLRKQMSKIGKDKADKLRKASDNFVPRVSLNRSIDLAFGTIRKIGERLDALEARVP